MPIASAEFPDRANVTIPLLLCGRGPRIQLGISSRWDEHPHRESLTLHLGRLVDDGRVVGSIGRDGCYPIVDLFD